MRPGTRGDEQPQLRRLGDEPQLGAARARAPDVRRAGRRDGVQHRQHAPAVGDSHEGDREEHVAVCQRGAGQAARLHARAVAARPAGHLFRRQRHADDAAADAGVRRAVSEQGTRQRPADRAGAWVERSCEGRARNRRPGNPGSNPTASSIRCAIGSTDTAGGCTRSADYDTCFAWGYGGQYVFVLPALDLVIVTTSSPDVSEERRGHRRVVFDILESTRGRADRVHELRSG